MKQNNEVPFYEDPTIPKLKIDGAKLSNLLSAHIFLKSYNEYLFKYLHAIIAEPSPTKKKYYGLFLEKLVSNIQNDRFLKEAPIARDKFIDRIINFIKFIEDENNLTFISDQAHTILESGQRFLFADSATKAINEDVSFYLRSDLVIWINSKQDNELLKQCLAAEKALIFERENFSVPTYNVQGQKHWDSYLSITEKLFPPKSISHSLVEESKKFKKELKQQKDAVIAGILNSIKMQMPDNRLGLIMKRQLQNAICSYDINARMAQIGSFVLRQLKKLLVLISNKLKK